MKPKLLLLTNIYPYGNGETFVGNELKILKEYFSVHIITDSHEKGQNRLEQDESIRVDRVPKLIWTNPDSRKKALRRCLFTPELFCELMKVLFKYRTKARRYLKSIYYNVSLGEAFFSYITDNGLIDLDEEQIIYSYWNNYKAAPFLLRAKKNRKWRIVSRIHSADFYNESHSSGRQPIKSLNKRLDRFYFLSRKALEFYNSEFGKLPEGCGRIMPLGVFNSYSVPELPGKRDRFVIVSCSRVVRVKRLDRIVSALELINDIPVEWIHFGDGVFMDEIKEQVAERLDKPNISVSFKGSVENQDILRFYSEEAPNLFLNVSDAEGTPVSIMEILSFGIPIVSFVSGSIEEMLEETGNILMPMDSTPEDLAKAIKKMYDLDEAGREKLRRENLELWEKSYNADTNGRKFALELKSLLS